MLAVFIYVHSLRWTVPCFVIMGVTPLYMTFWSVLRTITAPFPQKVYRIGDDVMFSQYMRLILFFFHTYVNPKVSIFICDRKKDIQQTSNFNILENRKIQVVEMARSSLQNITTYSLEHGLKATYICMTYTLDLWSCYLSNMEQVQSWNFLRTWDWASRSVRMQLCFCLFWQKRFNAPLSDIIHLEVAIKLLLVKSPNSANSRHLVFSLLIL